MSHVRFKWRICLDATRRPRSPLVAALGEHTKEDELDEGDRRPEADLTCGHGQDHDHRLAQVGQNNTVLPASDPRC
jgi:hypothetical protein